MGNRSTLPTSSTTELVGVSPSDASQKLTRKQLINRLNSVNFHDATIPITLKHSRFGNPLVLTARPEPCSGETLHCTWSEPDKVPSRLDEYSCSNFLLNDGKSSYAVKTELLAADQNGITVSLPAISRQTAARSVKRFEGTQVQAQIFQNGCQFLGHMVDFSSLSMRIDVELAMDQSAHWINPEQAVELILYREEEVIFSGRCRIARKHMSSSKKLTMVIVPIMPEASRYPCSEFRSSRLQLVPAPSVSFTHPLTGRLTSLLTRNISGTGFAVDEPSGESLLVTGLIIPQLQIQFTSHFSITCRAQVVYLKPSPDDAPDRNRFGLAFLDMSADDHLQLLSIVHRADNEQSHFSFSVDTDRLMEFFFNVGFFYPEKYAAIAQDKERLKDTYMKLYNDCPTIARHYIYQDNNAIYAHMAAVRFYQKAWMIHHHAANGDHSSRAGLDVMKQMTRWINDSRNIPSVHLDYFFCYYRDNNRFPMRVFGGICDGVNNREACSIDSFAYYHHQPDQNADWDLDQPWSLQRSTGEDLRELGFFYEASSGGLMISAQDLHPDLAGELELNQEYLSHGFSRERHMFSLKSSDSLKAVFIVNKADFGLNLSELTSAIQVFVPDHEELPRELLDLILSLLCLKFKRPRVPVLLFPRDAAEAYNIEIEKTYLLWIYNSMYMDDFYPAMKKITRSIGH